MLVEDELFSSSSSIELKSVSFIRNSAAGLGSSSFVLNKNTCFFRFDASSFSSGLLLLLLLLMLPLVVVVLFEFEFKLLFCCSGELNERLFSEDMSRQILDTCFEVVVVVVVCGCLRRNSLDMDN